MTLTDKCIEALRKEAAELREEVARLRAERQAARPALERGQPDEPNRQLLGR
jgi:hypothetical protein